MNGFNKDHESQIVFSLKRLNMSTKHWHEFSPLICLTSVQERLLRIVTACMICIASVVFADEPVREQRKQPLVLAHYMPWYTAKPPSDHWGWHWTMNHFDPERRVGDRRDVASHFYPLIGPYDSGDTAVLEYHLLLMKLAGIDGVIVDWYGLTDLYDYATLHLNTARLVDQVSRLGMKFTICYEDQTVPALIKEGRLDANGSVQHVVGEVDWAVEHWFDLPCYVRIDDLPVLLSFGHAGLTDAQWTQVIGRLKKPVAYFSEHMRRDGAIGGFDWPVPNEGLGRTQRFKEAASDWQHFIPVAYPRFVDIYKEATVNEGYADIEDADGATFRSSLAYAFAAKSSLIQLATWNDWGEGTIIEPSIEYEYRDLEIFQRMLMAKGGRPLATVSTDLRLPHRLLALRRLNRHEEQRLNAIALNIASGELMLAKHQIEYLESK